MLYFEVEVKGFFFLYKYWVYFLGLKLEILNMKFCGLQIMNLFNKI